MRLAELNAEQRLQLKQGIVSERDGCSCADLADADALVTDAQLEDEFGGTEFSPDDFS